MHILKFITVLSLACVTSVTHTPAVQAAEKSNVDYVNPFMGNVSHLLVPTFPTIHLPNSMLRVYPERGDFTADRVNGLPLIVTSHRGSSAFNLSPVQGDCNSPVLSYSYDNEVIRPYYYSVTLDERDIDVEFAPSHQSALYKIKFLNREHKASLVINSRDGEIKIVGNAVCGYQQLSNNTRVYIYLEPELTPSERGILQNGQLHKDMDYRKGHDACAILTFDKGTSVVNVRYGISFISTEQAKKNMERELPDFNLKSLAKKGRQIWMNALGHVDVKGGSEADKTILYTSLYRTFERPVCISEDGRYFSAFDGKIHEDHGTPFYTDDWIWDTYRATHPLRLMIDASTEKNVIDSYLRMAEQMGNMWMPTFPEITGDSRRMNSNHAVATVADAAAKGLKFDLEKAYICCKKGIEEKTLIPWSGAPAGWLDNFYKEHGYIPALREGEPETVPCVVSY